MREVLTERYPIKLWLEDIEDEAMKQVLHLANLPFLYKHVAIMPDSHKGYGMPIGGVIATKGVVIPNAVGVDIGCGMCAVKTNLLVGEVQPHLKAIMGDVRSVVPVGFSHQELAQNFMLLPDKFDRWEGSVCARRGESIPYELGTLGGGNHFIEFQADEQDLVWIMIHSGSRNLGKQVADFYNKEAVRLNVEWYSQVPVEWELAFLPLDHEVGKMYMQEMQYCVDFALANRKLMMAKIQAILSATFNPNLWFEPMINIAHNYAAWENHFGQNVVVHRKGATRVREGEHGIIPGSQGTSSYIVCGLGNRESFMSCSHGAGRKMGRKQAERTLDLDAEVKALDDRGIIHSVRTAKDLDEAPGSYKDIDEVMAQQADLVQIVTKLRPLAVIKG